MGQAWQRPPSEPRLGKLEVWVERARNLAPELDDRLGGWTDAKVRVVVMLVGAGGSSSGECWRAESERKVGLRHGLKENAPVFRAKVVGGWPDVPHPPPSQMTATVVYSGPGGQDRVLGIARIPTQRYWTVEQPVAEPTGEGRYHWIPIVSVARSPPRPTGGGRDSRVGSAASSASSSSSSVVPSNGAGKDDAFRGEIKLAVKWTQTEPEYRGWVWCLYALILRTQRLVGPVARLGGDRVLDWLIEAVLLGLLYRRVYQRLLLPVGRGLRRGIQRRGSGPFALLASLLMTSCLLPLLLVSLPLLLLWPLTLAIVSGTTLLIVALTPLGALGLWLLYTTRPVQAKLMRPLLHTSLHVQPLRRLLTVRAAPGW